MKKLLAALLILTLCFTCFACKAPEEEKPQADENTTVEAVDTTDIGDGNVSVPVTVTFKDGTKELYTVHTSKLSLGEALLDCGLIAGDETEYGLYIKSVNGVTADYNIDGTYWAFYINGEYANTGVDSTEIEEGVMYELRVEEMSSDNA